MLRLPLRLVLVGPVWGWWEIGVGLAWAWLGVGISFHCQGNAGHILDGQMVL